MVKLKEEIELKKRLAYIPDRYGTNGIAKEEFFELARNYVLNTKLSPEVHIDISRIFCFMMMKAYYNTAIDSPHGLAPFLRYLFDTKHDLDEVMKMNRTSYVYRDIRELIEQILPLISTQEIADRLLVMLDAARTEEYRSKISSDRAINWKDKVDSKKGT